MKRIDRYLLTELSKRLAVALAVVLISLVIERLLRLFDLVSMKGGPLDLVWRMVLMLVPHYLGLALPAGFFVSIFLVVARFSRDSEFDALLAGGVSPGRFSAPFFGAALVLTGMSIGIYGYVQPYTRYDYRAIHYLVMNIPWVARIPELSFSRVDKDATVSADRVDETGRELSGVFIHMAQDGRDVTVTARTGKLLFGPGNAYYRLRLFDGVRLEMREAGSPTVTRFDEVTLQRDFATTVAPFRARGNDVRELSLGELARGGGAVRGAWTKAGVRAELHARLIRALALPFLPFLAIPLALTAKRSRKSVGIAVGAVLLVLYHYVLQTLQGLAASGRLPVGWMWLSLAVFAGLSALLFRRVQSNPGQNPLDVPLAVLDDALGRVGPLFRHLRRGWR
ncbi:LptF/LptG family permease [Oleispirillum naphthae]|uniref:LptF/LptG family permease n=1 Tax=Oleispirillum naphthae TaxID=2838853 RepID=UPI00308257C3